MLFSRSLLTKDLLLLLEFIFIVWSSYLNINMLHQPSWFMVGLYICQPVFFFTFAAIIKISYFNLTNAEEYINIIATFSYVLWLETVFFTPLPPWKLNRYLVKPKIFNLLLSQSSIPVWCKNSNHVTILCLV